MGNYTEAIERLINIIESKYNFKVIKYCFDLPENVVGRIDYKNRLIMLNEPTAKEALMTLCHEFGHLISFAKYGDREQPSKSKRELWAYFYGWKIVCRYNLKNLISKQDWKEHHKDEIEEIKDYFNQ